MLSVIEEGGHTRGMTDRMRELEAREDVLKTLLAQEPTDIPDIHANVSGIYRKKVERLTEALNNPEDRNEAAEAIRALVEKITLRPGPNRGEIDATLHGELGTILGGSHDQAQNQAKGYDSLNRPKDRRGHVSQAICARITQVGNPARHQARPYRSHAACPGRCNNRCDDGRNRMAAAFGTRTRHLRSARKSHQGRIRRCSYLGPCRAR
jgi:hypothetical protein